MPIAAAFIVVVAGAITALNFLPVSFLDVSYEREELTSLNIQTEEQKELIEEVVVDVREVVQHVPLPEQVKAIYMTQCVAGTPTFRAQLIDLMKKTEINSVMIDIKDYSGTISFPPESDAWKPAWQAAECGAYDMKELIAEMHKNNIFVIGRITVFQDPFYAPQNPELAVLRSDKETVWRDHKGLSFIDVASKPYWDHVIDLSVDAYNIGFDELNYDYVRYPSDGNMADTYYPQSMAGEYGMDKRANLEAFFAYLHEAMRDGDRFDAIKHENTGREVAVPYLSADLFGMTTTNYDDLSIGQIQDRAAPYFDFIAPMVYPSHYPDSFLGLGNPNDYPYEVVYHAMKTGADRMMSSTTPLAGFQHEKIMHTNASGTTIFSSLYSKPAYGPDRLRTWIQDFDYGGDYDAADVRAQIQPSYHAGIDSWMIWSPSNRYTLGALQPSEAGESNQ